MEVPGGLEMLHMLQLERILHHTGIRSRKPLHRARPHGSSASMLCAAKSSECDAQ